MILLYKLESLILWMFQVENENQDQNYKVAKKSVESGLKTIVLGSPGLRLH